MSLSRRGFLASVLGASAAALVLPKIELIAASLPRNQVSALDGPVWNATFREIHLAAVNEYLSLMAAAGLPVLSVDLLNAKLGYRLPSGEIINHQLNVSVHRFSPNIAPAMKALSQRALYCGIDKYAAFEKVRSGVGYCEQIGPIRMVSQYILEDDFPALRFDVIGATNDAFKKRFMAEDLKQRIRKRLSAYKQGRIPAMW